MGIPKSVLGVTMAVVRRYLIRPWSVDSLDGPNWLVKNPPSRESTDQGLNEKCRHFWMAPKSVMAKNGYYPSGHP